MNFIENKKYIKAFIESNRPCNEIEIAEVSRNVLCLSFDGKLDFFINHDGKIRYEQVYIFLDTETRKFIDDLLKFLKNIN